MTTKSAKTQVFATTLHEVRSEGKCPDFTTWDELAEFLHHSLKPYQDTVADIRRGLRDAFREMDGGTGFVLIAEQQEEPVGALVMLRTGMAGYIPANLLLFVAVSPDKRGEGIGKQLVKRALELADGDVKLHVEYDNPAKGLYEAIGFETKYAEMRFTQSVRTKA